MERVRMDFHDAKSGDAGFILVRRTQDAFGLCVSLESNGDVEVFLSPAELRRLGEEILGFASNAEGA